MSNNGVDGLPPLVVTPESVGAVSEVYLVRPGLAAEIGKTWRHLIRGSGGLIGPVLLHEHHKKNQWCYGHHHYVVTADGLTRLDTEALLGATSDPVEHTDEHTEDVHLLKMTLKDARDEILRLRAERAALERQRYAAAFSLGDVPVSTGDALGPETPQETAEIDELARDLREGYTPETTQSVGVQVLSIFGAVPYRGHQGDAGFDLYVSRPAVIEPGTFVDIHCDVAMQLPPDVWGLIIGRSSTIRKRGLLVTPGIIDSGWRGELFAGVWNLGSEPVEVAQGERLAQFIPMPLLSDGLSLDLIETLDEHDRGTNGFGSTGR